MLGDESQPIRASLLPMLLLCPRFYMERVIGDGTDRAGPPAETGNLCHVGIQAYHTHKGKGGTATAHAKTMLSLAAKVYPQGDIEEALSMLDKYIKRDAAERRGTVIHSEEKIEVRIPPADFDPTKKDIVIIGTVDQVRAIGRTTLYVVDHKTGWKPGVEMVQDHMTQLAAYTLGVMRRYPNHTVQPFITRIRDLIRSNLPFWWPIPLATEADCLAVLGPIRTRIAELRMSVYDSTPGKHCEWCNRSYGYSYPTCNRVQLGYRCAAVPLVTAPKPPKKPAVSMDDLFGGK